MPHHSHRLAGNPIRPRHGKRNKADDPGGGQRTPRGTREFQPPRLVSAQQQQYISDKFFSGMTQHPPDGFSGYSSNLSVESLEHPTSLLNELATTSGLADPMCSRSEWLFAYHHTFAPKRRLILRAANRSLLALAEVFHPVVGALLEPVESHWFFPCPLLGPDAVELLAEVLEEPATKFLRPCLAISGLQADSALPRKLLRLLGGRYEAGLLEPILFRSASLENGADGFLSRRSAKFRGNLRRAEQKALETGIYFERQMPHADDAAAGCAYRRMLRIEARSWKGREACGISREPFSSFYGDLFRRMCTFGLGRVIFARRGEEDIGFVMGGVDGVHYRGQQFSFADEWRAHSVGNLLQWEMIRWLCEQGIQRYDLGSVLDYKVHWAELELKSHAMIWRPVH